MAALRRHVVLGVSSGFLAVNALVAPQPRATESVGLSADGMTPAPTAAPRMHELLKRQNGGTLVEATVFDETCGYISGSPRSALTCIDGYNCILAPSIEILLCAGDDSYGWVGCLDSTAVWDTATCGEACLSDTLTLKCASSTRPFCRTYSYDNGVLDWDCASTKPSGVVRAAVTYSGEDLDSRSATVTTFDLGTDSVSSTGGGIFDTPKTTPTSSPTGDETTSETSSSPATTTTSGGGGGGGGGDDGKGVSAGAIAGGVVGGIAVIGLVGLAIIFMLRKKKNSSSGPEQPQPIQQQPQQPQMYQQQQQQQPPQQQPPPPLYSPPHQMAQPQFMGNMPPAQPMAQGGDGKMGFVSPHSSVVMTPGTVSSASPAFTNASAYPFNQPPAQSMSPPPQAPSPQQTLIQPQAQLQQGYSPPPPQQQQQQQQQPTVYEMGTDSSGHHKGNIHEM